MSDRCGFTVLDNEEREQPCDRPATGWRWYQDVEHEDMLDAACDWHKNEAGRIIAAAKALMVEWETAGNATSEDPRWNKGWDMALEACATALRAALGSTA